MQFASRAINLTRIESRPRRGGLGHYMFFCDLDGPAADPAVGEQAFDMMPGDMCFFPADVFHTFSVTSDTPVKLLVI